MTPTERAVRQAVKAGEIVMRTVEFDCLLCRCNFDFVQAKMFGPDAFVLAHVKSCRLRSKAP